MFALGVGLDLLGMLLTGAGLARTWRQNSGGNSFLRALGAELRQLLPRRKRPATVSVSGTVTGTAKLRGIAVAGWPPSKTTHAQKLDHLLDLNGRTFTFAVKAQHRADDAHELAQRANQELREELNRLHEQLAAQVRDIKVGGLPLAAFGVFLAAIGTVLQAIA